ncbi:hypothetical protein [Singulisphaera acidiphila]|uniref:Carboxypeptidase regulatory-like domain-containing protein n=1 Tax=Singulisphaera acidiphila (strain ATCC BAA-1392 / DSM 18658 / VKM B-2454 / MOB10) TaxID=886293 RepID=L0DPW8_SINAD|nr:hypothetical protein [Singulisphaera acidiphila]AGA31302.1 hypothetical protein Sinac_7259 [Singulisphaera acidiphila DSM 18658]
MSRARWEIVGLAIALISGWGCNDRGGAPSVSSSMEEATVKGTVTIKGKTATGGQIQFDPSNVDRKVMPRVATIGADGTYTITTLVDDNVVTIVGPKIDNNLSAMVQTVKVSSGKTTIPIEVPPPAPKP